MVRFSSAGIDWIGRRPAAAHYLSDDPDEELASYVDRYLTEEVAAEGLTRNLPGVARFLQTAAFLASLWRDELATR